MVASGCCEAYRVRWRAIRTSLRFYVPDGYSGRRVELPEGLTGAVKTDGHLVTVDYTSATGKDVEWKAFF
jgi:hypothetical protein